MAVFIYLLCFHLSRLQMNREKLYFLCETLNDRSICESFLCTEWSDIIVMVLEQTMKAYTYIWIVYQATAAIRKFISKHSYSSYIFTGQLFIWNVIACSPFLQPVRANWSGSLKRGQAYVRKPAISLKATSDLKSQILRESTSSRNGQSDNSNQQNNGRSKAMSWKIQIWTKTMYLDF